MEIFIIQKCNMCDKQLPLGSLKYVVSLKIVADYDEVIQEDDATSSVDAIQMIVDNLDDADPQKLEEDVYMERIFLLCPKCKRRFSKGILGVSADKDVMERPFH